MLGTNVIKPEKELVKSEKLASRKLFKDYLSQKHGVMPAFQEIADDTVNLKDLYAFVRKLKVSSWDYPVKEHESKDIEPKEPEPPTDAQ